MFFWKIFMFLLFKIIKSYQKAMNKVRKIVFCCKYIIKMVFVIKLRLHEGKASDNLALPLILIFFNLLWWISQNCHNLWKRMGVPRQFPRYLQFCVFFLCLKLGIINCFCQQALERAQMFKGPANLGKFHRGKRDKSYSKDPYFLCCKTLLNGIGLRQDRCLSTRRLSNPAIFPTVFSFLLTSFSGAKGLWVLRV